VKQTILDVLEDMSKKDQINLGSEGARKVVSNILVAALKEKGEYKKYTNDELEEQEAREYWVCEICKKSSYDLDWDYIGSGTNHLSCEVRLELDEQKLKERRKKLYEDQGDGHLLEVEDSRTGKDRRERITQPLDHSDRRKNDRREKNKLSEEIVDNDLGYIYESPDGGETVYKRKFGEDKRELVDNEDWEKLKNYG